MKQTALITGASSGIGLALAHQFASENWNLVLVARRQGQLERIASELRLKYSIESQAIGFDLASENAARALFDEVRFRNLEINCLVNNAGRGHFGPFMEQDWKTNEETIFLNITVLTSLCRIFGKEMVKRGDGRILNIASIAGFLPGPNFAVYHASKAYVLSLSRALDAELRPAGVSVTTSCPGPTESEFFDKAGSDKIKAKELISLMSAEKVAKQAYKATMQRQPVVVHGLLNRLMSETPRFIPTTWMAPIVKAVLK